MSAVCTRRGLQFVRAESFSRENGKKENRMGVLTKAGTAAVDLGRSGVESGKEYATEMKLRLGKF